LITTVLHQGGASIHRGLVFTAKILITFHPAQTAARRYILPKRLKKETTMFMHGGRQIQIIHTTQKLKLRQAITALHLKKASVLTVRSGIT
jgi:hypothetical protein